MRAWISETYSDDEPGMTMEGKLVTFRGAKAEIVAVANYMAEVVKQLESADYCHMHLRDCIDGWSKGDQLDIEITVDERSV